MELLEAIFKGFSHTDSVIIAVASEDLPGMNLLNSKGVDTYLIGDGMTLLKYKGKHIHFLTEDKLIKLINEDIST